MYSINSILAGIMCNLDRIDIVDNSENYSLDMMLYLPKNSIHFCMMMNVGLS